MIDLVLCLYHQSWAWTDSIHGCATHFSTSDGMSWCVAGEYVFLLFSIGALEQTPCCVCGSSIVGDNTDTVGSRRSGLMFGEMKHSGE